MIDNYVARSDIMHMYARLMWSEYGLGYPSMVHPALNKKVEGPVHRAIVGPIAAGVYQTVTYDEHPTHTHLNEWITENEHYRRVEPERVGRTVRHAEPGLG